MEEKDVIEVEVLSETQAEVEKDSKPKKNVTYLTNGEKADRLFAKASKLSRWGNPLVFLFAAAGLTFSILYSQNPLVFNMVMMLFFWFSTIASIVVSIIAYILRVRAERLLKKDSE